MPPPPSLKARALQWLAQREHSRSELRRKLMAHARRPASRVARGPGADPSSRPIDVDAPDVGSDVEPGMAQAIEQVLDVLEADGHLSESRFVESRLHVRAPRFGHRRIEAELARHGIEIGTDRATALRASEFERARDVWQRKFGRPAADPAGRLRQMRFLAGRGFDAEVIRRVVPAAGTSAHEQPDAGTAD
jgi:regulatory protein